MVLELAVKTACPGKIWSVSYGPKSSRPIRGLDSWKWIFSERLAYFFLIFCMELRIDNALLLVKTACPGKIWFSRNVGKSGKSAIFGCFSTLNERPGTLNGWIWRIFCFSHLSWQYGFKIYSRPCILKLYFWSKNRTRNIWCEKQQKTPYFTFVSVQLVFFVSYKHVAKHL